MKFHGFSFQHSILFGFLVVALVPLLTGNMLIVNIFHTSLQNQMTSGAQSQVENMARSLDNIFSTCSGISREITRSPMISRAFLDRSDSTGTDVNLALSKAGNGLRRGAVLSLYDVGGTLRFTSDSSSAYASLPVRWGALRKAREETDMVFYNIQNFSGLTSPYVMHTAESLYTPEGMMVGYALISLPNEVFQSAFVGLYSEQDAVFLLDSVGEPVYSSRSHITESEISFLRDHILNSNSAIFEDEYNRFYIRESGESGFYIILRQPKPFTGDTVKTMRTVVLLTSAGSLLLCVLFSTFISRGLSRPISRLSKAMEQLKQGELSVRVETKRNDQLGRLLRDFNIMAEHLQLYINKSLRQQREMEESRIRLLQAQLNPHFLYNTLDTVKWLAKINHIPEIADISSNLALILRECASSDDFVPLCQELDMIKGYVDIQRIRFSGKFQYIVNLPKQLEDCFVPKLILQPIVENAILHGLEDQQNGCVYVYVVPDMEGNLYLSVTDDGTGMPPHAIERLNHPDSRMVDGHLGLYNVSQIIKLHYGDDYGLHASSLQGIGTTITIKIPARKTEENRPARPEG